MMPTQTKPKGRPTLSPLERRLETLAAENATLKLKCEQAQLQARAAQDAYRDLESIMPEGAADEAALADRLCELAEAFAMLVQHPDYPKEQLTLNLWWHYYFYTCGLARLDCNDVRDQVSPAYKSEPFTTTALRFAEALATVLECGNLPVSVYNALCDFAIKSERLLPVKYKLSPPQQEATRLRALFTAYADAGNQTTATTD